MKSKVSYNFVIIFILSITPLLSFAQYYKVMQISEGLSNNTVKCMTQDKYGFIWLGTFDGLCRFDGNKFTIYKHNPKDSLSITDNHISAIHAMSDGIWIGTDKGLSFFSLTDNRFYTCKQRLTSKKNILLSQQIINISTSGNRVFVTDSYGNLLTTTYGNLLFEPVIPNVKKRWLSTVMHPNGMLLASATDGIYLLDIGKRKIISQYNYKANEGSTVFYSLQTNNIYIGSGLGFVTESFTLDKKLSFKRTDEIVPPNIKAITEYKNKLVFGSDGNGLIYKDKDRTKVITPQNSNIASDAIYSLFVDKDENLWIGTYRGGVSIYSDHYNWFSSMTMKNRMLTHNMVTSLLVKDNKLYIGLDGGGLNIYDLLTNRTTSYTAANSSISGNNVLSLSNDDRYIWMGVFGEGLCRYSPKSNTFKTYNLPTNIWKIQDTKDGYIWVIGQGLMIFDKNNEKFNEVENLRNIPLTALSVDGENVWISSRNNGLYKFNRKTRKIVAHYPKEALDSSLESNLIRYLFVDSKHKVWFFSEQSDLKRFDEQSGTLRSYELKDGISNQSVVGMLESHNYIWISTLNGLYRFDPSSETFTRFDKEDNMPSAHFNYDACLKYDNTLYFGSNEGIVYFKPDAIQYKQDSKKVFFTGFELISNNKKTINLYTDQPKEIHLPYDQNFFTITFSVPELISSGKIQFSCYLENFEEGWRNISHDRQVSYTNVPPGEYLFFVRSSDSEGRWNSQPSLLRIIIAQPWWRTNWAMSLWFILILAVIFVVFRLYRRELRIKHIVQLKEIEKNTAKSISEAKLSFFTNITHELRTPIFLLTAPLEELLSSGKSPVQVPKSSLSAMYRNAMRLNKLISRIIDFRKLESNKLKLEKQNLNVVAFCKNLTVDYEDLCQQKDIIFYFHPSKTVIKLYFDPDKLESILSNLLSNAFKYTHEKGRIILSIDENEESVIFSVEDNGIGIGKEYHEIIFDSFYQIDSSHTSVYGDGIGLSFVKYLVELHKGEVRIESELNRGSKFIFTIPKISIYQEDIITEQELVTADSITDQEHPTSTISMQSPTATFSILIIDDEKETIEILERFLVEDFKIFKASNGIDGLALAGEKLPDIIICDLMMPKMNGSEFLSQVKADKKLSHIPVIMFTAKNSEEDKMAAFDGGADAYLTKPVSLKYLRKRIDHLINQRNSSEVVKLISKSEKNYTKEEQRFLLKCREIIDNNLTNIDFNIVLFAEKLGMSHSAMYKRIKQITGLSVFEFINEYKIFKAVQYFKEGESNVNTVMIKCGFKDARSFRESFKQRMQMTPKQFIKQI